jgi:endo-alpha-1,4-polygalactosaminidase (GH114 family)
MLTWLTNCHDNQVNDRVRYFQRLNPDDIITVGAPKASPKLTQAELAQQGFKGIYRDVVQEST